MKSEKELPRPKLPKIRFNKLKKDKRMQFSDVDTWKSSQKNYSGRILDIGLQKNKLRSIYPNPDYMTDRNTEDFKNFKYIKINSKKSVGMTPSDQEKKKMMSMNKMVDIPENDKISMHIFEEINSFNKQILVSYKNW